MMRNIYHAVSKQKRAGGRLILMSEKIDFKAKSTLEMKKDIHNIKI